jgi:predicted metal-dependent hydrolase
MRAQIQLGDIAVDVVRKDIKNVHLSVHPPTGRVTISAPSHLSLDSIRIFAVAKLGWIRRQQKKLLEQERETPREYLDRESHYVWGQRYLLKVVESDVSPLVEVSHCRMILRARSGWDRTKKQELLEAWYREQLKAALPPLVAKWEWLLAVKVERIFVQRMKTKWGSCNPCARTLRLNADLAKKPRECLEYIVVHEMVHLLESTHNARFIALMDQFLPKWTSRRQVLNQLPVRHERWGY